MKLKSVNICKKIVNKMEQEQYLIKYFKKHSSKIKAVQLTYTVH